MSPHPNLTLAEPFTARVSSGIDSIGAGGSMGGGSMGGGSMGGGAGVGAWGVGLGWEHGG